MNVGLVSRLAGLGHYVPLNRIANDELEKHFHLESGWIAKRTGIVVRRWASEDELLVDLAERAGLQAIENASIARCEIALTILVTSTPDHLLPPTAPLLASRLDLSHSCAFDLSGACSGFLHALLLAESFVRAHAKAVLIVAANILSRRINVSEKDSAILFGDAAAAIVVEPSSDATKGILGMRFLTDGAKYDLISISAGGNKRPFRQDIPVGDYKIKLHDGPAIFSEAVKMMTQCSLDALQDAKLSSVDINYFIPHQANNRMAESIAKKIGISSKKIISVVNEYGNTSSAGIPLALSMRHQTKPFLSGEKIILAAAGAGMTAGAIVWGI